MTTDHYKDGLFIPPHPAPLTGDVSLLRATKKMIKNPIESFGELSYKQPIVSAKFLGTTLHTISGPKAMQEVLAKKVKILKNLLLMTGL